MPCDQIKLGIDTHQQISSNVVVTFGPVFDVHRELKISRQVIPGDNGLYDLPVVLILNRVTAVVIENHIVIKLPPIKA